MATTVFRRLHGWSALLGLAGFVWCTLNHVCCGGHMAHEPYPWWHYVIDGAWVSAFVVAIQYGLACHQRATPVLLAVLVVSRLGSGSGSGFFLIPELFAVATVAVLAFIAAVGPTRRTCSQPTTDPKESADGFLILLVLPLFNAGL